MTINVCIAGATGWAGSALAMAVHQAQDLELVGAVSRKKKGQALGDVLGGFGGSHVVISASVAETLATPCDVMVEYTRPDVAKPNILSALNAGAHVVVGTSGLTDGDYAEIDATAKDQIPDRNLLLGGTDQGRGTDQWN